MGTNNAEKPKALMLDKLRGSGLTEKLAKLLGLTALSPDETKALGPEFCRQAAIRIPYFDPEGKPTRFYRVRYVGKAPGFAGNTTKPQRYAQKAGGLNEVYLPPLLKRSWAEILADPKTPIVVTEGEFKAAAGCARGLCVLGLGGVSMSSAKKKGFPDLLPVLDTAEWKQREVYILWDSDVGTKPDAIAAQRSLAYRLAERGALPRLGAFPPGPEGAKVGLDDYLLENTPEQFNEWLAAVESWEQADKLWELNQELVFSMSPPVVIARRPDDTEDLIMSPKTFTEAQYANRHVLVDGKTKRLAKMWLEWPQRFQAEGLSYQPAKPSIVDGRWNSWRGWGVEPAKGDVRPFLELVGWVFRGDPDSAARKWFLQWLAYPLQHPGTKLFQAVLLWGVEGSGKSFIGEIMRDLYGRHNASRIGASELHGSFNKWAWNKQFILAEEVTGSDKRSDADNLKGLITQETITINEKYVPTITLPDCANYYLTSNHPNALYMGDKDRRYFILHVREKASEDFYLRVDSWRKAGGSAALFHYLLTDVDLAGFNPKGPAYVTQAKEDMISDTRSHAERWIADLRDDPTALLLHNGNTKAAQECDLWTPAHLFRAFNPDSDFKRGTENGFYTTLRGADFRRANKGKKIKTRNAGAQVFVIIRNADRWTDAKATDCAAHWDACWSPRY